MLGQAVVCEGQSRGLDIIGLTHDQFDIGNYQQVLDTLKNYRPDVVINCAGIVKGRPLSPEQYRYINGACPHVLACECDAVGARLVQISSDCVFAGDGPHVESDLPNAVDIYGRSKALGEVTDDPHLTIRTSFIGNGSRGLLAWLKQQQGEVQGYINVRWNGLTAPYAAKEIVRLALLDGVGVVHLQGQLTTKYEVLMAANKAFGLGLRIIPAEEPKSNNLLFSERIGLLKVPGIEKQIEELAVGCDSGCSCRA